VNVVVKAREQGDEFEEQWSAANLSGRRSCLNRMPHSAYDVGSAAECRRRKACCSCQANTNVNNKKEKEIVLEKE
jgi:hypothetical protein